MHAPVRVGDGRVICAAVLKAVAGLPVLKVRKLIFRQGRVELYVVLAPSGDLNCFRHLQRAVPLLGPGDNDAEDRTDVSCVGHVYVPGRDGCSVYRITA